ncbi:hypothetical protein MJ579_02165 [Klebsiella pneumoniae]|nr:hypothetical protein MJ579_02165 [Klebsiella pneumoniae]
MAGFPPRAAAAVGADSGSRVYSVAAITEVPVASLLLRDVNSYTSV